MLITLILVAVVISAIVRLITLPFRLSRWHRPFYGYGNPYGYGYPYGYRRRHGLGHLIFVILILVALSHLFGHHHHCI